METTHPLIPGTLRHKTENHDSSRQAEKESFVRSELL